MSTKPGQLQSEAYAELPHEEQVHFETNCYVLVRLLQANAVDDVREVVLATNTQNPMQPRNMRSNSEEQVLYERLFAKLGWFYERKEGAWDGFKADPHRWRSLSEYKKKDFYAEGPAGVKRHKERRLDNEELAQTWLSFIGFSNEAVHLKREIFEDETLYHLAFLARTSKHGSSYDFKPSEAREEAVSEAPSPEMMLVSHFAREVARTVPVPRQEARQAVIERLRLASSTPSDEVDRKMLNDPEFLHNMVLLGMSFVFVEFFGYILFKALGDSVHSYGRALLSTGPFPDLVKTASPDGIVESVRSQKLRDDDLLGVAWCAFGHLIDQLLAGPWKDGYLTASPQSRFNHSKDTRSRILRSFEELETYMERAPLTTHWTTGIPAGRSISAYFREVLERAERKSKPR